MEGPLDSEFTDIVGAAAYMAGKADHIAGVVAQQNRLMIRLIAPVPDIVSRLAQTPFCPVPTDTPLDPSGVPVIPMAGPYYITSYTPDQSLVMTRNPNYHGSRPHSLARIELTLGVSPQRAAADIERGAADYTTISGEPVTTVSALASKLAARYGPGSKGAARGRQQYFDGTQPELDYLVLNTHRALFSDVRLRRAVNYAIDRRALARLGNDRPTDSYLPPGIPGAANTPIYPLTRNAAKAKTIARGHGRTAILDTCDYPTCVQEAQIIRYDLAAIGLRLKTQTLPPTTMLAHIRRPGTRWDAALGSWAPDYSDPQGMLDELLEDSFRYPPFDDPYYNRQLAATAKLTGLQRYLAYGKLATELARDAAPLVAFGNAPTEEFFSARVGCQTYSFYYGVDLAALCLRGTAT